MPLTICTTRDDRIVSAPVAAALREALDRCGRALLLVPSFSAQLDASRALAELGGLGLGVTVTTPLAWARERWEVWGDGTRVADTLTRSVAAQDVLFSSGAEVGLADNPGTAALVARLAKDALPWLLDIRGRRGADAASVQDGDGLSGAEAAAVRVARAYERHLEGHGFVEESVALTRVVPRMCEAGAAQAIWPVAVAGFQGLRRAERTLLAQLAAHAEVTLVCVEGNPVASGLRDRSLGALVRECEAGGVRVGRASGDGEAPHAPGGALGRAPELSCLLSQLFSGEGEAIAPTGAVSLLTPAGPLAEAEAITREVLRLAAEGDGDIVICAPDPSRAWRELAPKLLARGVSVRAELPERVGSLEAGRAFVAFAQGVARLAELDETWPAPERVEEETPAGGVRTLTYIRLGDMGWWPPRGIVDFLLAGIANVPVGRAQRLDRTWRGDRLLTPARVLATLQNPAQTSPEVAAATRELLRGRVGSAASRLLRPYVEPAGEAQAAQGVDASARRADPLALARDAKALEAVIAVSRALSGLGLSVGDQDRGGLSLAGLVRQACGAISGATVVVRPEVEAPGATARVLILPPGRLPSLAPRGADALVLCGLTSEESGVGTGEDIEASILERLGLEPAADPLAEARAAFWSAVAVPRRHLSLERTLFDADAKESYPSVMLTEALACYGSSGLPSAGRAETRACENLSPRGQGAACVAREALAESGAITGAAARLVNVPRNGDEGLPDGKPILSASQIESYLECPYKWFSLRRLRLEDSDVAFSPTQMGTFAHRVLEVTHRALLEEALDGMARRGEAVPDPGQEPEARVPGSRLTADDPLLLAHARELLVHELEEHTRHQFLRRRGEERRYALVPHTAQDEGTLRTLRRDLLSVLDYEASRLVGYEPRLFEWDFGQGELVPYAGAWIRGTVDRVDVDAHGNAIVIDYKHRRGSGLAAEYGAIGRDGAGEGGVVLPRHVQSLIYGQVVRRRYPQLSIKGAVYLTTGGTTHTISGAVDEGQVERVFGEGQLPPKRTLETIAVRGDEGMEGLLDETEEAISRAVRRMMDGHVEARPVDARACAWCPVMNCERRMGA